MKIVRRVVLVVAVLGFLVSVVGLLLPAKVHVERSIAIAASPELVYSYVSDLKKFHSWSPWVDLDPAAVYTFSSPTAGEGAVMTWQSDNPEMGRGSKKIIEAIPHRYVKTELNFGQQGKGYARFTITPAVDDEVWVTWSFDSDMGRDIVGRYFGLLIDGMVGPAYEKGLRRLKEIVQAQSAKAVSDDS